MISRLLSSLLLSLVAASLAATRPVADPEPTAAGPPFLQEVLPPAFPLPAIPAHNPASRAKSELGRRLFYDPRLSGPGTTSCGSCHQQAKAFTDGRARARGATGALHPRSSMSLTNVAYNASFGWADPTTTSLEAQVLVPLFNTSPIEMGVTGREAEILERLRSDPSYQSMFRTAFPDDPDPIQIETLALAIATFERTILSGRSRFDRYAYQGDLEALDERERRGLQLFFSPELGCSSCHAGFNFSGPVTWHEGPLPALRFHDNRLQARLGSSHPRHPGLMAHTGDPRDRGKFRAPTLRNIELTSPYMHDGRIAHLEDVLTHYLADRPRDPDPPSGRTPGLEIPARPWSVDSRAHNRADLVAFLLTLTDLELLEDPRLGDPFAAPRP